MELVDRTNEDRVKLHSVFAASLPRVGEVVTPQNGSPMKVVSVEHAIIPQDEFEGMQHPRMVPQVLLEPIQDENDLDFE